MRLLGSVIKYGYVLLDWLKELILWTTQGMPVLYNELEFIFEDHIGGKNKFMIKFSELGMVNLAAIWVASWFTSNVIMALSVGSIVSIVGSFIREFYDDKEIECGFNRRDIEAGMLQAIFIWIVLGTLI